MDIVNVETVVPAIEFAKADASELPFAGRIDCFGEKLPLFDMNFALTGEPARRMFGTRYVISKLSADGGGVRAALMVEAATQVAEFEDFQVSGNFGDEFRVARSAQGDLKIAGIEKVLGKSLQKYGR